MAAPTLYKKKSVKEVASRPTYPLTSDELTRVKGIVSTFFEKFKEIHLS